jgi:hypothetical membrane protein
MRARGQNWRQWMFLLTMIGCVQFVVLTTAAMWLYPGGTYDDPTTTGYSFFENYFSDLGLTKTPSGESNRISSLLFATALALAGICLVLFFVVMPRRFTNRREARQGNRILFPCAPKPYWVGRMSA